MPGKIGESYKKPVGLVLLLMLCLLSNYNQSSALPQKQKDILKDLSPAQREWLEIVTPIITETEREVFFKLKTEQERDHFIRFFWQARDPDPATSENEFYREYMERVHFADRYFGIGSSKRGCLTERGFYYLLLGKPLERQVFATQSNIWPMELWFYQGEQKYGLPGYFYLLFYQPEGVGDYRLYYPGIEGPEKLVVPSVGGERLTRSKALEIIKAINAELGKAAISYLPEDRQDAFSSLSSQTIVATINSLPEKKFATAYAGHYFSYRDLVEVDYSHNFITSSAVAKIFKTGDHYFIHWSLEPDRINFAENQGVYSAIFELTIRLEDLNGNPVFSRTEEIPLRLNREQFETRANQRFAFQDLFPVLPGEYKLLLLLKNKTAKDFTSWESKLNVPKPSATQHLSQMILYHASSPLSENRFKAFSFNQEEYLVSAKNEFSPSEKLSVFCQVLSQKGLSEKTQVKFCLKGLDQEVSSDCHTKLLKDILISDSALRFELIDLSQVRPGYYQLEVLLVDEERTIEIQKENLIVLHQPVLTAPWVYGRVYRSESAPEFLKILASQNFLKGNYQEARLILEKILSNRDESESRLLLAKTLFALGDYDSSLKAATQVYESTKSQEAAKVIALDYSRLKDWEKAQVYIDRLMAEATEISVLNLAAEVYQNLGNKEKAISLLEKSLALLPEQPAIKSWLEDLKRKGNTDDD